MSDLPDAFGPVCPDLPVKKTRAAARRDPGARREHGEEVLAAVRQLQRRELARKATPVSRPNCASGTWNSGGPAVLEAIRDRHRRALHNAVAFDHKRRTDEQVQELYEEAMRAKKEAKA